MDNGGSAFPAVATQHFEGAIKTEPHLGMSLRDYFAAVALRGRTPAIDESWEDVAALCYWIADRMLAERGKS